MYPLLALLNGAVIGTSRAVNGMLGNSRNPINASMWNHAVGCLFLTIPNLLLGNWRIPFSVSLPLYVYMGGIFGAIYVAVQSSVFVRMGAVNTTIAVISGQMASALVIDHWMGSSVTLPQFVGASLIFTGVYISK